MKASLTSFLIAFREYAAWLEAKAADLEAGRLKVLKPGQGEAQADLTADTAAEYRHKAGNLKAVIVAFERLEAKGD